MYTYTDTCAIVHLAQLYMWRALIGTLDPTTELLQMRARQANNYGVRLWVLDQFHLYM